MNSLRFLAVLAAICLGGAGCGGNVYFSDDEGGTRPNNDSYLFSEHPDELSQPYAQGTKVNISINRLDEQQLESFTVVSDTPSVFSVDRRTVDNKTLKVECTAAGEGQARIRLLSDKGEEQRSATVTVKAADRAILLSHGPLRILGRKESAFPSATVQEVRVLTGSKGVYALAYFRGEERLYGRGIATSQAIAQLSVENHFTTGAPVTDWIFINPAADGSYQLVLTQAERTLLSIPVTAVPESEVALLGLAEEITEKRSGGQSIWVLGQAQDHSGRAIDGVYSTWTLGGVTQKNDSNMDASGDLYRYVFDSKVAPADLIATHGSLQAKLSVTAEKGSVYDTTYLGCSAGQFGSRRGEGLGLGLLALFLAGLVARSRRSWQRRGLAALR